METALAIEGRFHEGKKSGSTSRFFVGAKI
jgi:hypothetical protein